MSAAPTSHVTSKSLTTITGLALQRARQVEVILGMAHQNCRFHGICRIEEHTGKHRADACDCQEAVPAWLLRPEPNYCVLMLWRGRLRPDREAYHFDRKRMEVGRPLNVSNYYATRRTSELYLRGGSYAIRKTKDYYILYLPLETR